MKPHYRAVFLSDTHLGTHMAQTERLATFLRSFTAGEIYLVGDIFDLKALRARTYWDSHTSEVLLALWDHLETTPIYYVLGNHDEALQPLVGAAVHPNLSIMNEAVHRTLDKQQMLVFHGHQLHSTTYPRWVERAGTLAYDLLMGLSGVVDRAATHVSLSPPNLMQRVKAVLPQAQRYITETMDKALDHVYHEGFNGVVFGHIHTPGTKGYLVSTQGAEQMARLTVYNTGDWVENCTALVEHTNGTFEIIEG